MLSTLPSTARPRLRALEQEVLEEVAGAADARLLVPGARLDPEAERDRSRAGHPFGDDPEPRLELRAADRHRLLPPGRAAPVAVPVPVAIARAAVSLLPFAVLRLRSLGDLPLLADWLQVDLAHRVDLLDLDLELVALLDGILDPGQALALPELGDVHEPVAPRNEVHERAERRGLDDRAVVALPHQDGPRVRDVVDHARGLVRAGALAGPDEDGAVVLDVDVGAGHRDDLVDALALRPDHLADLVDGDLDRQDPRRLAVELRARLGERS